MESLELLHTKYFLLKRNLKAKAPLGFICQCKTKRNLSPAIMAVLISRKPPFIFKL